MLHPETSLFMKNFTLLICLACLWMLSFPIQAQNTKKPLDHSVYNDWKSILRPSISNDGRWVAYEVNPQDGDGCLIVYNIETQSADTFHRANGLVFSHDVSFAAFTIKPSKADVRAAKKAKKKKDEMPADSLGIFNLQTRSLEKHPDLKSFDVPKKTPGVMAFYIKTPIEKVDTASSGNDTIVEKKPKAKPAKKDETGRLVFFNFSKGTQQHWDNVSAYTLPENGRSLYFTTSTGDSLKTVTVMQFDYTRQAEKEIFSAQGEAKELCTDKTGSQAAWLFTPDTSKVKAWQLAWFDGKTQSRIIADTLHPALPKAWCPSEHGKPRFSELGTRLFFDVAPIPRAEPEDTLLDEEKYKLDIWHWQDPLLQTQQLKNLERDKKRTWMAIFNTKTQKIAFIQDSLMNTPFIPAKGEANLAIATFSQPYLWKTTYDIRSLRDVYLINPNTAEKTLLLEAEANPYYVSPDGNYLLLYEVSSNTWFSYNLKTLARVNISKGLNIVFQDEDNDMPLEAGPYGIAGWLEKESGVLVYDRFDLWLLDPSGKKEPVNYTANYGRSQNIRLRYVKTDADETHIPVNKPMLLEGFHYRNKEAGFLELQARGLAQPKVLIWEPADFGTPRKAQMADNILWTKGNFNVFPDLHVSSSAFKNTRKISEANPQMKDYKWGNVQLVEWVSFNNDSLQGLLYTPENIEPGRQYPMLVYFYERSSDDLYRHMVPSPSRSIINRAYCTSNDYVVFVPDIVYRDGQPGQSAYDAIVSGTNSLVERFAFINRNKIGLQGQSWGGYQIAWLITRTNMFNCAMAGAPVSNMTSAYGGIRWESGRVRQFQYEQTQSRIGGTLWEKPWAYIENSPLFYADKVNTPLLMMSNDNDGAVPWYQGIEYFTALRRLNKPVWMLVYNGEEHNLMKRPNMHDLTIRMYQFFDHFLKDQPAPKWLQDGLPAINKGKDPAY